MRRGTMDNMRPAVLCRAVPRILFSRGPRVAAGRGAGLGDAHRDPEHRVSRCAISAALNARRVSSSCPATTVTGLAPPACPWHLAPVEVWGPKAPIVFC